MILARNHHFARVELVHFHVAPDSFLAHVQLVRSLLDFGLGLSAFNAFCRAGFGFVGYNFTAHKCLRAAHITKPLRLSLAGMVWIPMPKTADVALRAYCWAVVVKRALISMAPNGSRWERPSKPKSCGGDRVAQSSKRIIEPTNEIAPREGLPHAAQFLFYVLHVYFLQVFASPSILRQCGRSQFVKSSTFFVKFFPRGRLCKGFPLD